MCFLERVSLGAVLASCLHRLLVTIIPAGAARGLALFSPVPLAVGLCVQLSSVLAVLVNCI